MKKELKERILNQLDSMDGKVGFYFKNLVTGETFGYNEKEQFSLEYRKSAAACGHAPDEGER